MAMAERVPVISVTDPLSKEARPLTALSAQSPVKKGFDRVSNVVTNGISYVQKPSSGGSSEEPRRTQSIISQGIRPTSPQPGAAQLQESPTDPLSRHIIQRVNSPQSANRGGTSLASSGGGLGISGVSDSLSRTSSTEQGSGDGSMPPPSFPKDKKKGVSFFSRLIGTKRQSNADSPVDSIEGSALDDRPEGADAELFYEPVDNIEFSPRHPQPPKYIRVHSNGKKQKDFDRLFLAQELHDFEEKHGNITRSQTASSTSSRLRKVKSSENDNATWALEFSHDGKYIASGGQEKVVRVWTTLSSMEDRKKFKTDEDAQSGTANAHHLRAPVFSEKPFRIYEGHTNAVLDLSWSKNNFLLSSSMDKTVRLWHVSRAECLCAFKHTDFVTSIQFHPRDDRFFLAGSLDSKLRLWSIPDKSVAYWNSVPEMITAVCFTPDGKAAMAGCITGQVFFYETEGLKYSTQMHVKSAHGKNAKGSKITGIQSTTMPPTNPNGDVKLLITSNDSRIRLYNLRDKSLEIKFKGNVNNSSQTHARFSDDCRYVICGSEDHRVFIWSLTGPVSDDFDRKGRRPVEVFEAHNAATTVCAIAPRRTRQLLGGSEDPVYDLCNPPPVKLVSRSEAASIRSGRFPDDSSSIQQTPPATETGHGFSKSDITPAYLARSNHLDGGIIVTADATGCIKVFRQDCAYDKRLRSEWGEGPAMSRAFGSSGMIRRQSSLASRRSAGRKDSDTTQPPRDRILSWRQSIGSVNSTETGASRRGSPAVGGPRRASHRGTSPQKVPNRSQSHRSSLAQASNNGSSPVLASSNTPPSDAQSVDRPSMESKRALPNNNQPLPNNQRRGADENIPVIVSNGSPMDGSTDKKDSNQSGQTSRPTIFSTNTNTYFQRDAWHMSVADQLRRGMERKKKGDVDVGTLAVPGALPRGSSDTSDERSIMSDISVLTDDASSEGGSRERASRDGK